jgi:hypothetical protein
LAVTAVRCLAWGILALGVSRAQAASDCTDLWRKLVDWPIAAARYTADGVASAWDRAGQRRRFDGPTFDRARAFFDGKLERHEAATAGEIRELGLSRPAVALALMESAAHHAGARDAGLGALETQAPQAWRRRALQVLGSLDLSGPVRWEDAEAFLEKLYLVANLPAANYPGLPAWLARRLPDPPRALLRQRLQLAVWREDLAGALAALGFARTPGLADHVRSWLRQHPNLSELAYTGAVDTFSWYLVGFPYRIPRAAATQALALPPDVVERARTQGLDAIYPELQARFGGYARFDAAWNAGRAALYRAGVVVLLYALGDYLSDHGYMLDYRYWVYIARYHHISDDELKQLQEQTFDAETVRREQFESFKQAYGETEGPFSEPLPDPWDPDYRERVGHFPPEYAREADETWQALQAMTPDELRAQFGPTPAAAVSAAH